MSPGVSRLVAFRSVCWRKPLSCRLGTARTRVSGFPLKEKMASKLHHDSRALMTCLALSLLVHLLLGAPLDCFKPFQLSHPVPLNLSIMVDLGHVNPAEPARQSPPSPPADPPPSPAAAPRSDGQAGASRLDGQAAAPADEPQAAAPAEEPGPGNPEAEAAPAPAQQAVRPPAPEEPAEPAAGPIPGFLAKISLPQQKSEQSGPPLPPVRKPGEFLAADWELLTYRISMLGIGVGTAQLEASREKGEVRITLHIRSNAALSQWYPVDDSVETRHIGGDFILSRIRQREGAFRGDRGFTLFLRDKSVFWIDRLRNLSVQEPLPDSAVVDILSGLYYLRNQPLEVGKPVLLELFDSNRYAPTTVVVLGKEHLRLPGLREVDTVLINPQLKTEGIFRRTGDILIWLTDDQKRVPVRVETRIPLGKVTAELVSAESRWPAEAPAEGAQGRQTGQVAKP